MKCDFTGKEVPEQYLTSTLDGFNIQKSIYTIASRELKKTFVSLYEVFELEILINKETKLMDKLITFAQKIAIKDLVPVNSELREIIKIEDTFSRELFKKEYKCMTREEHIKVMEMILKGCNPLIVANVKINKSLDENKIENLRKFYLEGRSYCQIVRF